MTIPKLALHGLDTVQHGRRVAESINNILDFSYDQSRARTKAEAEAGVTPTNSAYGPGEGDRFGLVADSSTDNSRALQDLINGSAGHVPVRIRKNGSGYYRLTTKIELPANTTLILEDGAELRWTATVANGSTLLGVTTRPGFEITGDNVRILGEGILRGPSSGVYVGAEIGIWCKGTSTSNRRNGLTIAAGIEICEWGSYGVIAQFLDNITVDGLHTHDCGYAGSMWLSCNHGSALGVRTYNITPGTGGNAYGFSLTHDSTDYDLDANASTNGRLAANPFCVDWDVSGAGWNIPIWVAFDAHGGYELRIHHIATYNCRHGVHISGSSGDAAGYAGENNSLDHIVCTTKKRDGSATDVTATDRIGINISGGTTVPHRGVRLSNFVLDGYGDNVVSSQSVRATDAFGIIANGVIRNWKGHGIYTESGAGTIQDVILESVADATNSVCVLNDGSSDGSWDLYGVKHKAFGGTVAAEGHRVSSGSERHISQGCDFSEATAPYAGSATTLTKGISDITPYISATGTPTSVDVAAVGRAPRVRIEFNTSGGSTVTDFANAFVGQIIECYFPTTNATVIDRTNAALAGGSNFSSTQYDTLVLECVATSGTKFVERSRSANS